MSDHFIILINVLILKRNSTPSGPISLLLLHDTLGGFIYEVPLPYPWCVLIDVNTVIYLCLVLLEAVFVYFSERCVTPTSPLGSSGICLAGSKLSGKSLIFAVVDYLKTTNFTDI